MRIPSEIPQGAAAEISLWSTGACRAISERICFFFQHCLPGLKLVSSVLSTSKLSAEHNKALQRTAPWEKRGRDGKREEKEGVWILTHALPVSPCCSYSSSLFFKVWDTKKVLYKLCEALGVESFSCRFGESGNQEFILAVHKSLKVILQHKSNTLELRKFPLARTLHDLRLAWAGGSILILEKCLQQSVSNTV